MQALLQVESAHSENKFIGYRLTVDGDCGFVIFADQKGMPGIRRSDGFNADVGELIEYRPCAVGVTTASKEPA